MLKVSPAGSPRGQKPPPQDIIFYEYTLSGELHPSDPAQSSFGTKLATRATGVPALDNNQYGHVRKAILSTLATASTAVALRNTYASSGKAALKVTAVDLGNLGYLTTAASTVQTIPYAEGAAPVRPHLLHVDLDHEPVTQSGESHSTSCTPATTPLQCPLQQPTAAAALTCALNPSQRALFNHTLHHARMHAGTGHYVPCMLASRGALLALAHGTRTHTDPEPHACGNKGMQHVLRSADPACARQHKPMPFSPPCLQTCTMDGPVQCTRH